MTSPARVLFGFGLGYSASHYVAAHGASYGAIAGTVRTEEKAARLRAQGVGGRAVEALAFDDPAVGPWLERADHLLISVAPDAGGDPVLAAYGPAIARGPARCIVYLSTVGVYGDHGGAWIDESAPTCPVSERSGARVVAEQAWQRLAKDSGKRLAILRLSGIYGPGQNTLLAVARGQARRIVKPGQVFNRIHVDDIASAIEAALRREADGIFNVTDNEPEAADAVITFAAALLGRPAPEPIPFDVAAKTMSAMALSFYGEVKRVRNARMTHDLGVTLRYPTYREGLRALFAAGDHLARD